MIRYPVEKWTRFALGAIAFAMALLLTPRAFLDVGDRADSYEVPVDMLDSSDDCLWCTPSTEFDVQQECDDPDGTERHWLNADEVRPEDLNSPCRDDDSSDEVTSEEPSA